MRFSTKGLSVLAELTASATLVLICLLFVGCVAPRQKTNFELEVMREDAVPLELWAEVFNYTEAFSKRVEQTADGIMEQAEDPEVRRQALLWKMNAIPVCMSAQDNASPVGCLIDVWAVSRQMRQYFADGYGRSQFGELQPLAISTCAELEADVSEIARAHLQPEQYAAWEHRLAEWTAEHVISDDSFDRPSGVRALSKQLSQKAVGDVFSTVENLETEVYFLRAKVGLYADHLPRQARWQAELLMMDALDRQVPPLLTNAYERLAAERMLVLEDVDRQRLETLKAVQAEREIVLEALQGERRVILEDLIQLSDDVMVRIEHLANTVSSNLTHQIQQQRLDTLEFIRKERMAMTRDMDEITRGALGEFYGRLWFVLAAVWVGMAGLLVVARWLFGRRTEPKLSPHSDATSA